MSAKTVYLVFGSPATPHKTEEVAHWYEPHLIEMCTLPGLISAQLYKPADVQLPRLTTKLPQTMALYEFDTDDLAGAFKTLWASSLTGRIAPPADGLFELDPKYQSAVYELDCEYPENWGNESPGDGLPALPPPRKHIMLVFGSPTSPERKADVDAWWKPHVKEMTSSPGLVACSFYRPSDVQLPRLVGSLPENMAICEFDTSDLNRDVTELYKRGMEGYRTGVFDPDKSIAPPPEGSFLLDNTYQTGIFELVSQWPKPVA